RADVIGHADLAAIRVGDAGRVPELVVVVDGAAAGVVFVDALAAVSVDLQQRHAVDVATHQFALAVGPDFGDFLQFAVLAHGLQVVLLLRLQVVEGVAGDGTGRAGDDAGASARGERDGGRVAQRVGEFAEATAGVLVRPVVAAHI